MSVIPMVEHALKLKDRTIDDLLLLPKSYLQHPDKSSLTPYKMDPFKDDIHYNHNIKPTNILYIMKSGATYQISHIQDYNADTKKIEYCWKVYEIDEKSGDGILQITYFKKVEIKKWYKYKLDVEKYYAVANIGIPLWQNNRASLEINPHNFALEFIKISMSEYVNLFGNKEHYYNCNI